MCGRKDAQTQTLIIAVKDCSHEGTIEADDGTHLAYSTWRYHTDPTYRATLNEKSVAYRKERCAKDPEYNARMREKRRIDAKKYREAVNADPVRAAKHREVKQAYQRNKRMAANTQ